MLKKNDADDGKDGKDAKESFETRLARLEALGEDIRRPDIPLDDALRAFEEGIRLARDLEKDLERAESRIEILMNGPAADAGREKPELSLFGEGQ